MTTARQYDPAHMSVRMPRSRVTSFVMAMGPALWNGTRHIDRAAKLQPGNPDTLHILGRLLLQQGRLDEAALRFEETLRLAPGHPGARDGLLQARRFQAPR